ncbi:MAG: oxidoreductase [Candidatus Acetothermia bacterium]|jgi:F420-non-reducing hydrogenase small subunit|nr:oxidoreductase [Candidatus Acetothermia bacterium]MDH7504765.1 oxidoreductase [Candidatus Acetothermia bacterium]
MALTGAIRSPAEERLAKPKVAFYWCGSCGGCEATMLDLGEGLLDLAGKVEFVLWPLLLDFTREDLEALADGEIALAMISGMLNNSHHREMAELLRRKSRFVLAFGACAQLGGVPGLWNLYGQGAVREHYSLDGSDPQQGGPSLLPQLWESVQPLDQVIEVDYYLPGCPPLPQWITIAMNALVEGNLPPKGTNFVPDKALCSVCPRRETKPKKIVLERLNRFHRAEVDPSLCLLAQGLVCFGPATRAGCGALCIRGNMPCTGCFGPTDRDKDYGTRALAAVASLASLALPGAGEGLAGPLPDPAGVFYFYSLAALALSRARKGHGR